MGEEFAIICTYEDGERSVHYVQGTKERALEEAKNSYRMIPTCECVTIARVCGYVFNEFDCHIH